MCRKTWKQLTALLLLAVMLLSLASAAFAAEVPTLEALADPSPAKAEMIINVDDTSNYSEVGIGWSSSSIKGYEDGATRYCGTLGGSAIWTAKIAETGRYEAYLWRVASTYSGALNLEYTGGNAQTLNWKETQNAGWIKLGDAEYSAEESVKIKMSNPEGGALRTSAVKFVKVAGEPQPPGEEEKLIVDTASGGDYYKELEGSWTASGVKGHSGAGTKWSSGRYASAEWQPVVTDAGSYKVEIYHPVHSTDVTNEVKLEIIADGQSLSVKTVTWAGTDTAGWIDLGDFELMSGQVTVRMSKTGQVENPNQAGSYDQALRADAVRLVKGGGEAPPELPEVDKSAALVIDFGNKGYTETGKWADSGLKGYNGTSSRYSTAKDATASWSARVAAAGTYQVYLYRIPDANIGSPKVGVQVTGGTAALDENQNWKDTTSGWTLLGEYDFAADDICKVQVTSYSAGTTEYTRIDAVKFVYKPTYTALPRGTYYVDATQGSDENVGTSPETAWQTLDKVNGSEFAPGSQLLLKKGEQWTGKLSPKGSGTLGSPILLGSYGAGARPVINGGGCENGAVELRNQEHWEIVGLEVTNRAPGETLGDAVKYEQGKNAATRHGIYIVLEDFDVAGDNTAEHIYIKDCEVHDVIGSLSHPHKGVGIFYYVDQSGDKSRFHDVLIDGNVVRDMDRSGIIVRSQDTTNYSTDVVIQNNYLKNIGGDGIVAKMSIRALVQYNKCDNACARPTGGNVNNAAVWVWQCKDAVIQYNEVYNTGLLGGNMDGQAFDSDFNCEGTIIQYNYSHDNDGGLVLLIAPSAKDFNKGTIVRYNVSRNDKKDIFEISGGVEGAKIYNNTVYQDLEDPTTLLRINTYFAVPKDEVVFSNNIFLSENAGNALHPNDNGRPLRGNITFDTNLFRGYAVPESVDKEVDETVNGISYKGHWTLTEKDSITEDPKLMDPKAGETDIDFTNSNRLAGYRLAYGSPCIDRGVDVEHNGGRDFWGGELYTGGADIGAHELGTGMPDQSTEVEIGSGLWPKPNQNINVTAGEGGEVVTKVNLNGSTTYAFRPEDGKEVLYVRVNGLLVKTDSYTVPKNEAASIVVVFGESGINYAKQYADTADLPAYMTDAINYVVGSGLLEGIGGDTFAPAADMDRAMFATVLARLYGADTTDLVNKFADVEADSWYAGSVAWIAEMGITSGVSAAGFAPHRPMTRQELVTLVYRFAQKMGVDVSVSGDLAAFPDADHVDTWSADAMSWALGLGLINGRNEGLTPTATITRVEVAIILQRIAELLVKA